MKSLVYAIDFGTSNSLLGAACRQKIFEPIVLDPLSKQPSILRSVMYFPKEGEPTFGKQAIDTYTEQEAEGRFVRSIKKYLPMESFTATNINGRAYSLEDIISRFLAEMKKRADRFFQESVERVVLGRPARFSFDDNKDELAQFRLEKAARKAGFKDIHFLAEPLAAAYEFRKKIKDEKIVLVVDLGGGTSDFTVIKVHPGPFHKNDVLAIGGLSLAGDHLDGCIMEKKIAPHLGSEVSYKFPMSSNILKMPPSLKFDLMSPADITLMSRGDIMTFLNEVKKCAMNPEDLEKMDNLFTLIKENLGFSIFEEIEGCKKKLAQQACVNFKYNEGDLNIDESLSRTEFVSFTAKAVASIFGTMDEVINSAGLAPSDIDLICCTGGTSRVASVQQGLEQRFGPDKIRSFSHFHSVIRGLSEYAVQELFEA